MATRTCPHCAAPASPEAHFCRECGSALEPEPPVPLPTSFTAAEVLRFGWRSVWMHPRYFLTLTLLVVLVEVVLQLLTRRAAGSGSGGELLGTVVSLGASSVIGAGVVRATLRVCDGERPSALDLLPPSDVVIRYLLVSLLISLLLMPGLVLSGLVPLPGTVLLLVSALFVAMRLSFAVLVVVDRRTGPVEALQTSARITAGAQGRMFNLVLASVAVLLLGLLALGVGLLVAAPVVWIAWASAYRRLLARPQQQPATVRRV